jgi:hypothetical protein
VPVSFDYADESDRGPYPIPRGAAIEGGRDSSGDHHVVLVDRDACRLYELYDAHPLKGGRRWHAGSGAIWSLRSNRVRPADRTSADAAGLPILPGLARYDDIAKGSIDHALRFTAPRTRRAYLYPARHFASSSTDPRLPPMGLRVRLKASVDIRSRSPLEQRRPPRAGAPARFRLRGRRQRPADCAWARLRDQPTPCTASAARTSLTDT